MAGYNLASRWGRRALALGALGCLVVAAPARGDTVLGSSGGSTYITDSLTFTSPDAALVDLSCEAGTKATGGGFDSSSLLAATAAWSFPFPTSWRTYQYHSGSGMQTATGFLICKDAKLRYPERDVKVKVNKTETAQVSCPDAMHAAGGGGLIDGPSNTGRLNSSYPFDDGDRGKRPDDGWRTRAINDGGGANYLKAVVVCQRKQPRYVPASNDLIAPNTAASFPLCRDSEHVIGVGAKLAGAAGASKLHILRPWDNGSEPGTLPDDGTAATATNLSGANKKLTAYAICEK
jgi:hypothetical protein